LSILGGANLLTFVVYKIDIFILSIFLYTTKLLKILLFWENILKKALQQIAKGLENVWLPLLETFGTFCWGEIIEELRNAYKLKELINLPVRVLNNI
jgi:hypothetical protein